jgi:hypothetical protein
MGIGRFVLVGLLGVLGAVRPAQADDGGSSSRITVAPALVPEATAEPAAVALESPGRGRPLNQRHHRFGLDGGVGSAVGWGGATYAYSPRPWTLVEAGLGYGYSGVQLSLMPKLTLGSEQNRFVFGPGYSVGIGPSMARTQAGDVLHFLNVDLGYVSPRHPATLVELHLVPVGHRGGIADGDLHVLVIRVGSICVRSRVR